MELFLNKQSRLFQRSITSTAQVASLTFSRRDRLVIPVTYVEDGVGVSLGAGASGILGIKSAFGESYLAAALTWSAGTAPAYEFDLNLNTSAMEAAFSDDPDTVEATLQVRATFGDEILRSVNLPVTITNSTVIGDETAPTALPDLAGWGNTKFRFGATGEPEFYNTALAAWCRLTFAGDPPQATWTML
ncbi:MAG: hypothetical protein FGM22_08325 [Burkholderiaceae bacterium]|nr:hypothetical protein [Burkholderiaceae bacterium]